MKNPPVTPEGFFCPPRNAALARRALCAAFERMQTGSLLPDEGGMVT